MAAAGRRPIGNRIAPARFLIAALVLLVGVTAAGLTGLASAAEAVMIGFNAAAAVFLASSAPLLAPTDRARMQSHAERNDANRTLLLVVTGVVMIAVLVAVSTEVAGGAGDAPHKLLVLATLILAWLFSNSVYALHYAHLCYARDGALRRGEQGLQFPDTDAPDYADFVYFAFTLGMTFQTSDVAIASRRIRKVVTAHCLAAFVFNLGVVAFTINVLGR